MDLKRGRADSGYQHLGKKTRLLLAPSTYLSSDSVQSRNSLVSVRIWLNLVSVRICDSLVSVRILIKQTDMPSCVFIKSCWSLSKAYCIPGKLCHFQSSGIFKLQKNGWHYEKTNVIFGLSAPKNITKHQKIKIKKTRPKICCPVNSYSETKQEELWV